MTAQTPRSRLHFDLLTWLSSLILVLAFVVASIGLFWQEPIPVVPFTTLRGEVIELYGRGLYAYDTVFVGAGSRATDAVTLVLGLPLLVLCVVLHHRGSLRGNLLLLGTLVYFLYIYAGYALGTIFYNPFFLAYVVLFSTSLYAVVLAFRTLEKQLASAHISPQIPRRGPGWFMIASGIVTLVVWLSPLLSALVQKRPPALLGSYTGRVTDALDLGIITPAAFISGILILRRVHLGYLIALSLLILEIFLLPLIATQTVFQLSAGVSFTPGEMVGPIGGFVILGLLAGWVLVTILRHISGSGSPSEGS